MILQTIKTNDTCVEYYEDDSTCPAELSYPIGYYTTSYPSVETCEQPARHRYVNTSYTEGTVKLRLSPREMNM
jgi:hypothetical protein